MRKRLTTAITSGFSCLLVACATPSPNPTTTTDSALTAAPAGLPAASQLLEDLNNWLPGYYSNYTQVVEAGGNQDQVTDLTIRKLPTPDDPVYLFESQARSSIEADYSLYFVKTNEQTENPELHFARMTGSDLSNSLPESLNIGWQRVLPGCVIELARVNIQSITSLEPYLFGKSHANRCQFEDPVHGQRLFERSLSISSQQINISETTLQPGELIVEATESTSGEVTIHFNEPLPTTRQFRKHQAYEGTVSLNMALLTNDPESEQWKQSTSINLYDDGRVSNLYDTQMQVMDYAIRLSTMHWRDNEQPYLRVEAIHVESGEALAYSWFDPESEQVDWELDWLEVHLKVLELEQQ